MIEIDDLANLLHSRTAEGKLAWRVETDSRITTNQGANTIDVVEYVINNGYTLTFRNMNGVSLASKNYIHSDSIFPIIRDLFSFVKRSSPAVNDALNDIKNRLMHM